MATATLPIPPKTRRRALAEQVGEPSATGDLRLRFSDEIMSSLSEMADLAHAEVPTFVLELVESQIADFRARKPEIDRMLRDKTPPPDEISNNIGRRMSSEDEERVVVMLLEGTKVSAVAKRFSKGESTIRRTWKKRAPSAETIQRILFLGTRPWNDDGESTGGIQGIAERCGVSRIVAEAGVTPLASGGVGSVLGLSNLGGRNCGCAQ
jgi:hypothetical protein